MRKQSSAHLQTGFTLIELMVVIVIVGVVASLIVFNLEGIDQRKTMQARELLILDLKKIQRDASDQGRVYALQVSPATDVSDFKYGVIEYRNIVADPSNGSVDIHYDNKWIDVPDFPIRILPSRVSFTILAQDHQFQNASNTDLISRNAPDLIWFGNGESKPVVIQMYYNQKPVGELIRIDYLGQVSDE